MTKIMTQKEKKKDKRSSNKLGNCKTIKHAYEHYKEKVVEGTFFDVDYKTYREICEDFNKEISNLILKEAEEFTVPYRLGTIRIQKRKMDFDKKYMKIDWKKTKELGYYMYHMNDHTNNFRMRWLWTKGSAIVKGKKVYSFEATRKNKRAISQLINNPDVEVDYFE